MQDPPTLPWLLTLSHRSLGNMSSLIRNQWDFSSHLSLLHGRLLPTLPGLSVPAQQIPAHGAAEEVTPRKIPAWESKAPSPQGWHLSTSPPWVMIC